MCGTSQNNKFAASIARIISTAGGLPGFIAYIIDRKSPLD
jgi:hypothetical protein